QDLGAGRRGQSLRVAHRQLGCLGEIDGTENALKRFHNSSPAAEINELTSTRAGGGRRRPWPDPCETPTRRFPRGPIPFQACLGASESPASPVRRTISRRSPPSLRPPEARETSGLPYRYPLPEIGWILSRQSYVQLARQAQLAHSH